MGVPFRPRFSYKRLKRIEPELECQGQRLCHRPSGPDSYHCPIGLSVYQVHQEPVSPIEDNDVRGILCLVLPGSPPRTESVRSPLPSQSATARPVQFTSGIRRPSRQFLLHQSP